MQLTESRTAYGLTLQLPFACPVLPLAGVDAIPDVTVIDGPVPRQLASAVAKDENWEAESGRFLLKAGRRAGRFLAVNGRLVTLQRGAAAEEEMLSFHF